MISTHNRIHGKIHPHQGVTLVEVLIASVVMVALLTAVYEIYSVVMRTSVMGSWTNTTTSDLRNGLNLLRSEVTRITQPEMITQKGSELIEGEAAKAKLYAPSNLPFSSDLKNGDLKLLQFYMCQPGKKDVPGEPDEPPEVMKGLFQLANNKLIYTREVISQNTSVASKTAPISQIICRDPSKIEISIREAPATLSVKLRNFIQIKVTATHPRYNQTTVTETMEAPFEVPFAKGGFPND